MAKQISLKAALRPSSGRTATKKIRNAGRVPGIVYGKKTQPVSIALDARELTTALKNLTSENVLVDLKLENDGKTESRFALIQDVQHDVMSGKVLHLDLHEIAQDEKLRVEVSVEPMGEPAGVKSQGALLEQVLRSLHIECLPKDLPESIRVDVSKLEAGQSIHVHEIAVPEGVTVTSMKDLSVFACVMPRVEEEKTGADAATGELEVINEKKAADGAAPAAAAKPDAKKDAGKDAKK
ncbi:MAG: 50S ribosomal protein L25 [Verrucomicrobiota bacterium]|nr:50S ribosomal protein L25 [Verrucomicrobiota bacterium]